MQRRTFLFVLWNGGGNVPPMLRISERLVVAGHRVHVLGNASLRPLVERAGLPFSPFVHGPNHDPTLPKTLAGDSRETGRGAEAQTARDSLFFGPAAAVARDTVDAIARINPGVVAVDYVAFGGMVGAEAAGLPLTVLVPHVYPLIHRGTARRGPFSYMFDRLISGGLDALNRVRRDFGLEALAATREQYARAGLMVLTTYQAFDPPDDGMLTTARYVGPQLPLPRHLPSYETGDRERPRVVVSFSTAWQNQADLVRTVLGELSRLPVDVTFLAGPSLGHERFDIADNITVQPFVPHHEILPHAAAMVCHAGHGSAMGALCHGVPLVCVPFEQDQFDIARRVAELGAGLHVSRHGSPAAIRSALEAVIGEPRLRAGARSVREQFLAEDDPGRAVRELASACAPRVPASVP